MSDSNEVVTAPRLEKRTRRRFSVSEKKRLLAEAEALPHGEKGAWLRRQGLYAGQLSSWRKELAEQLIDLQKKVLHVFHSDKDGNRS